jgi:hypothetical protein
LEDWDRHVEKLPHEDRFHIRHRTPFKDFCALVDILGDAIVTNVGMSGRRCKKATWPEMVLAIGIRVLAGGDCDDIMNTLGVSKGGSHHSRNKFLNAALDSNSLDMTLPAAPVEWEKKRKGFASKARIKF